MSLRRGQTPTFEPPTNPATPTAVRRVSGVRRVGLGDLAGFNALTTGPNADPEFISAWQGVQAQLVSEGNDLAGDVVTNAKGAMADAFNQIGKTWGVPNLSQAAAQWTIASQTLFGAATTVKGLIDNATSIPPVQIMQNITGLVMGAAIAAGLSAGVGAAVIAGVAAVGEMLSAANLLPAPVTTPQICGQDFPYFEPGGGQQSPPFNVINCMGFILTPPGPYAQTDGSGNKNPLWIDFPDYTNQADSAWFQIYGGCNGNCNSAFGWKGGSFYSKFGPRLIDAAWPEYRHLECEAGNPSNAANYPSHYLPGVPGDFQRAFFSAWKANAALALNGQTSLPNEEVLAQLLRLWNGPPGFPQNGSHNGPSTFEFTPVVLMPSNLSPGPTPCSQVTGYNQGSGFVGTLITNLQAKHPELLRGGKLVINAGPAKQVQAASPVAQSVSGAAAATTSTSRKLLAAGVWGSVILLGGSAAYAAATKTPITTVWQRGFDDVAKFLRHPANALKRIKL